MKTLWLNTRKSYLLAYDFTLRSNNGRHACFHLTEDGIQKSRPAGIATCMSCNRCPAGRTEFFVEIV